MKKILAFVSFAVCLQSGFVQAREPASIDTRPEAEHSVHHVAAFTGLTTHSGHTHFTTGLDYGFRFSEMFAAVALADFAFTKHVTTVLGAGLAANPVAGLRFVLAPGVEFYHGHSSFLIRAGLGYDFHVGNFSVGPTYSADFVGPGDGAAHVYGLSFGFGF